MVWFLLLVAGAIEIVMAIALKYTDGWTKPLPSVVAILSALASIFLLAHTLKTLPMGTAYAIWTGVGAIGVTLYGIFVLGESIHFLRLLCIALITMGVIGLRMFET